MDRKHLILILCIVVSIGGIFLFKSNKGDLHNTESTNTSGTANHPVTSVSTTIAPEKAERIIAWSDTERKSFLKRTPLEINGGVAKIKTTVSLLKRCEPGDLDAIRLDFKGDHQKRLKIGFENLQDEKEATSFELPENFFTQDKFEHVFTLPISEKPTTYGFFICSTTNKEKCSDKDSKDINDIFVEHYNNKNYTPKDRLYFFQFALIDDRGMATFAMHPKGDDPFKEIEGYLADRGISSVSAKNVMEKSKKWTHTLGSLPVKFTSTSIELEIPQYSEEACGQLPVKK